MFNAIIVGIDGSQPAQNALKTGCGLARAFDADLHLVHAYQENPVPYAAGPATGYHMPATVGEPKDFVRAARRLGDEALSEAADVGCENVELHLLDGVPAATLLERSEALGADLIVMGRRGRGKITQLIVGSTCATVMEKASCACLTVT